MPALVTLVSQVAAWVAITVGQMGGIWALLGRVALNMVIAAFVGKLSKPKSPSFQNEARDRLHVVRSSVEPHRVVYGRIVLSGPLVYAESSGSSNEYLHLVVVLTGHEVHDIGDIWLNDEKVGELDGSGNVTSGRFAGYARIKKHLGTSSQAADSDLVSESAGAWTSDHRLFGLTYVYVRLKYSTDVFPTGIPNIKAEVWGKKVYDPRTSTTSWSENWALCVRDYLTESGHGMSCDSSEIDSAALIAAANIADERVAMSVTGFDVSAVDGSTITFASNNEVIGQGDGIRLNSTGSLPEPLLAETTYYAIRPSPTTLRVAATAANALLGSGITLTTSGSGSIQVETFDQVRYSCNGSLSTDSTLMENVRQMLTAGAGSLVYSAGLYRVFAGAYVIPTVALSEDDLRGEVQVQARTSRKDLFNAVRGMYAAAQRSFQPTDFPAITNATYESQDGGVQISRDIELSFTTNPIAAQRIAKIHLEKSRQGISVTLPLKLTGFKINVMDTFSLSLDHLGWNNKVFRCLSWSISEEGGVDIAAQEESSESYAWNAGEATVVDSAPDTILPSLINVAPPTGLTLASGATHQLLQADGITLCRVFASWTAAADASVQWYELQWKLTTESDYQSYVLPSVIQTAYLSPAQSGSTYDVRVRSVNASGAASSWEGPDSIIASSDATTVSVDYADVTGTKPPADADNTVDAVEAGATITSGGITFSAGGAIKGGQTDYNTGTGWFLGYSGGAYKFSIGNQSGNRLTFDAGTGEIELYGSVAGQLINTAAASYTSNLSITTSWTTLCSVTLTTAGRKLVVDVSAYEASGTLKFRIRRDSTTLVTWPVTGNLIGSNWITNRYEDTGPTPGPHTYYFEAIQAATTGLIQDRMIRVEDWR